MHISKSIIPARRFWEFVQSELSQTLWFKKEKKKIVFWVGLNFRQECFKVNIAELC